MGGRTGEARFNRPLFSPDLPEHAASGGPMLGNSDSTEKEKQRLSETTAASGMVQTGESYLGSATPIGADTVGLPCMMAISTRRFIRRFSGVVVGTNGWESAIPCTTSRP